MRNGLHIGIVQDLLFAYDENQNKELFAISIAFLTGEVNESGSPLPYGVGVKIDREDHSNYKVGDYMLVEIENELAKKWKLFREGDIFQKW